jgi:hypothetical protein
MRSVQGKEEVAEPAGSVGAGGALAGARRQRSSHKRTRTRWCRVRIRLHQLPGVALVNRDPGSSENRLSGSPTRTRTWNNPVNSRVLYH